MELAWPSESFLPQATIFSSAVGAVTDVTLLERISSYIEQEDIEGLLKILLDIRSIPGLTDTRRYIKEAMGRIMSKNEPPLTTQEAPTVPISEPVKLNSTNIDGESQGLFGPSRNEETYVMEVAPSVVG